MKDTRWSDLIPKLGEFSPELRTVALGKLDELLQGAAPDKLKRLWTKLRDEASRHARFQTAQWALKGADLELFALGVGVDAKRLEISKVQNGVVEFKSPNVNSYSSYILAVKVKDAKPSQDHQ